MATKLSLLESRKFLRDNGLWEAFQEDPTTISNLVMRASTEQGFPVDISSARDAGVYANSRAWLTEQIRDVTDNYVRKPLVNTFGDNPATRVISGAASGIAESLPEIAIMGLTRGRGRIPAVLGTGASSLGAGVANYNETGDSASALASGLTMGALPTMTRVGQRAASALGASNLGRFPQRLLSGGIGAGAGLTGDLIEYAYTPEMAQANVGVLGNVAVPTEKVNLSDFGRAGERLTKLDPATSEGLEQLAIMGLSEFGPGVVGLAMDKARKRDAQVYKNRQEDAPLNADKRNPATYLSELGEFDIPRAAPKNSVDLAYQRFMIEGEPSKLDIQRDLYRSVAEESLTSEQRLRKQELEDPAKRTSFAVRNMLKYGQVPEAGDKLMDKFATTLENISADISKDFDPNREPTKLSQMLDRLGQVFFDAPQNVATNPVAQEVQNLIQRRRTVSDRKVNDLIKRIGTIEGEISAEEASNNIATFLDQYHSNANKIKDIAVEEFKKRNKTLDEGRPNLFRELPDLTVEDWKNLGATDFQAKMLKNIRDIPSFLAVDSFNSNQAVLTNRLAPNLLKVNPKIGNSANAYETAKRITDKTKEIVGVSVLDRQMRAEEMGSIREPIDVLDKRQASKVADVIFKEAFNSDPATRPIADRLGAALFKTELGITMQYAKNKASGYMPFTSRGEYQLSYVTKEGDPMFTSFDSAKERTAFMEKLRREGATSIKDFTKSRDNRFTAQAFDQVSEIRRSLLEAKDMLKDITPSDYGISEGSDAAIDFLNKVEEATNVYNEQYRKVASRLSGADLTKTSQLERRGIGGINPNDLLPNLFELAEGLTRLNSNRLNKSRIELLLSDPNISNNEMMQNYFKQRLDYMDNQNTSEAMAFRNAVSMFYLAGSTGFIAQNFLQPYLIGQALWRTHTGRSLIDFAKAATKANKTIYNYEFDPSAKNVDKTILAFMRRATEDGVFDQSVTDETFARKKLSADLMNAEKRTLMNTARDSSDALIKYITMVPEASESLNRKTSFVQYLESENAYKPLSERTPQELERIYEYARQFADAVNFRGGKATRPELLANLAGTNGTSKVHGLGLTALSLTNYFRNLTGILYNNLRDTIPGLRDMKSVASSRYKNNVDRLALVKVLGMYATVAGAMGLPFASEFDNMLKFFGGDDENDRPSTNVRKGLERMITDLTDNAELGERMADLFSYGVPGVFGWNQQNVGANNGVLPVDVGGSLLDATGAFGQMVKNIYRGGTALKDGDYDAARRYLQPSAFRTFNNTLDSLTKGTVYDSRGNAVVNEGSQKGLNAIAPFFGATTTDVANARNAKYRWGQQEQAMADQRNRLMQLLGNNANDPERLKLGIEKGLESGILRFDDVSEITSFINNIAERSLNKRYAYTDYSSTKVLEQLEELYSKFGVDPQYVSPLQKTVEAIKISASLNLKSVTESLVKKLDSDAVLLKEAYQRKGVRPDIIDVLLKPEFSTNDIEKLKQYFNLSSTESPQSF